MIIAGPLTDPFLVAKPNTPPMGEAVNTVYFDGSLYTYVHEVIPSLNDNFALTTGFDVAGYTGTAGWSFSDAGAAGGSGTPMDFLFFDPGQLQLVSLIGIFDGTSRAGMRANRSSSSLSPRDRQPSGSTT